MTLADVSGRLIRQWAELGFCDDKLPDSAAPFCQRAFQRDMHMASLDWCREVVRERLLERAGL